MTPPGVDLLGAGLLRRLSYLHSAIYAVLLYVAFVDRHDELVTVFGWAHGLLWIAMTVLCLEAVRRRIIPLWLGVMVAVIGGIGPFAGSVGFYLNRPRPAAPPTAPRP